MLLQIRRSSPCSRPLTRTHLQLASNGADLKTTPTQSQVGCYSAHWARLGERVSDCRRLGEWRDSDSGPLTNALGDTVHSQCVSLISWFLVLSPSRAASRLPPRLAGWSLGFILKGISTRNEVLEKTFPGTQRNYTLSNLSCGTRYELSMKAFNSVGYSERSQTVNAKTTGTG